MDNLADIRDMLIDFMGEESASKILEVVKGKIQSAFDEGYSKGHDEGFEEGQTDEQEWAKLI